MKAIQTKYLGPTNTRGARIKAVAADGDPVPPQVTISWDDGISEALNHTRAAYALALKMNWTGRYVSGSLDGGYVFVNVKRSDFDMRVG